ncbi:hypothetical protein MMC18_004342 [Xylographa bjoerkii]|nr:hypothetical protein [Xylographa bjoerkii]
MSLQFPDWRDIGKKLRDILNPIPGDRGPSPQERLKQRLQDVSKGFAYFDTIDEVLAWSQDLVDPLQKANTPFLERVSKPAQQSGPKSKVLLCHDYRGGYHDYESVRSGPLKDEMYSCEYLQYVDSFVYFSHKLSCVPPPSWTNTLHRNGVKVFGTFLVEPQTPDVDRILTLKDGKYIVAEILANMAHTYGFDGWLLNIEKKFASNSTKELVIFIESLKEALGDDLQVIWYDALTVDNAVRFQNGLTEQNLPFAKVADVLFTNYKWTESKLIEAKAVALAHGLATSKISFGIDVWAQNKGMSGRPRVTFPPEGGGGTNTGLAIKVLNEHGFSSAIFGPAWAHEHFRTSSESLNEQSLAKSVDVSLWDGASLPRDIRCGCKNGQPHNTAFYEANPITGNAYEFPAGSSTFLETDFSGAFKEMIDDNRNHLYNSTLGSQSVLPHLLPLTLLERGSVSRPAQRIVYGFCKSINHRSRPVLTVYTKTIGRAGPEDKTTASQDNPMSNPERSWRLRLYKVAMPIANGLSLIHADGRELGRAYCLEFPLTDEELKEMIHDQGTNRITFMVSGNFLPSDMLSSKSATLSSTPTNPSNNNKFKIHQAAELERLDARLHSISEKIITPSPYLLTVPGERSYRLNPLQAIDWTRGTPFSVNEGELQYVSFLRRELGDSVLTAVGGWDNEKGELVDASPNGARGVKSGTSTPKQGGKKMTLADYKNKKAGVQPASQDVVKTNGTEQQLTIPSLLSPTLPSVVEEELARLQSVSKSKPDKSEPDSSKLASISSVSKPNPSSQNLTSSQDSKELSTGKKTSKLEEKSNTQTNLSTPEQSTKGSNKKLTPTQKLGDRSISASKINADKPHLTNGTIAKHSATSGVLGAKVEKPATNTAASTSKESIGKKRLVVRLKIPKARRRDVLRLLQMPPAKSKTKSISSTKIEDKVLIVNGKENDKFRSGRRDKELTQRSPEKRSTIGQKSAIRRETVNVPSSGSSKPKEKRARPEDDADTSIPQSKRQKHPSGLDLSQKPRTPVPPPFRSPIVSTHGSGQKNQDNKPGPARRLEIGDADIKTPQGSVRGGTPLAPNSIERVNRDGRSASNASSVISALSEESNAWKIEHKRLLLLGRRLKHEADNSDSQWQEKDEPEFEKKAIAISIECVLCFMLAYTISDEIKASGKSSRKAHDLQAWETMFAFIQVVKRRSQGHTLIHGLCLQLEAVCHNLISVAKIDGLANIQPPAASTNEDTLNPVTKTKQATVANEPASKSSQQSVTLEEYMQHKDKIAENCRLAQHLWVDGAFELSVDDLQQSFPTSWKHKSRAPLARSKEKLTLGNLNGDFYLPLSSITTGIEAIRAGWSLLGEWCKNEKVNWVGKLGL